LGRLGEVKEQIPNNYEEWAGWYQQMAKGTPEIPKAMLPREKIKPKSLKDILQKGQLVAGFTGTQKGMTPVQKEKVKGLLQQFNVGVLNHGMCVGADEQADEIAKELGIYNRAYPSDLEGKQAVCEGTEVVQEPKPPLDRNQDIVDKSYMLIATPEGTKETTRSGTWATVRRGRKKGMNIYYVLPDGTVFHQIGDKEIGPFEVEVPEEEPEETPESEEETTETRRPYEKPRRTKTRKMPEAAPAIVAKRKELMEFLQNVEAIVEKDAPNATPEEKTALVVKYREKAKQMLQRLPEEVVDVASAKKASCEEFLAKRARRAAVRRKYLGKLEK